MERGVERARLAAHGVVAVLAAWIVFRHVDVLSVDLAGHLSSAQAFARGYYHRFYDGHFLGEIHGLFYPPLEDLLLSAWTAAAGVVDVDLITAYRAYLAVVAAAYLGALAVLGRAIPGAWPRVAFSAFVLATFFLREDDLYLQGLKLVDLTQSGLTSQLLGGIFLSFLVPELLARGRVRVIALTLAGAVLAHMVVGLVAALLVAASVVQTRRWRRLAPCLLAAGVTAVFWVPFLAHSSFMVKNTVLAGHQPYLFLGSALVLLSAARDPVVRMLAVVGALLLLPSCIAPWMGHLPIRLTEFHWYRLDYLGLLLVALAFGRAMGRAVDGKGRWRVYVVRAAAVTATVGVAMLLVKRGGYLPQGSPLHVDGSFPVHEAADAPYGRHWILQDGRPFDFSAESLATALDDTQRTPKGLFWESARSNHLVGSYMASINHPPVVLDYFYFHSFGCTFQKCLVDQFLSDFNVTRWSADVRTLLPVEPDIDHRMCDGAFWREHVTRSFDLEEQAGFALGGHEYRTAVVAPRGSLSNATIDLVDPATVRPFLVRGKQFFHVYFHDLEAACSRGDEARRVLVEEPDWPAFLALGPSLTTPAPDVVPSFRKVGIGRFGVEVPSAGDVLFRIKLNYLPGVRLLRDDGSEVPLLRAYPGMLAAGHGTMTLVYQPTRAMRAGLAISVATASAWATFELWLVLRRRRKPRVV